MKNYKDSDYALNKYSDSIVYRFADGIVEVTMADYLAENPDKTEADFRELKEFSDADYLERDRLDNACSKRNVPIHELDETALCCAPLPEDIFIGGIDEQEEADAHRRRLETSGSALEVLSDVQRRRYLLYRVDGLNEREIAELEGATQQAVSKSLYWAEKKIKKFLGNSKK